MWKFCTTGSVCAIVIKALVKISKISKYFNNVCKKYPDAVDRYQQKIATIGGTDPYHIHDIVAGYNTVNF